MTFLDRVKMWINPARHPEGPRHPTAIEFTEDGGVIFHVDEFPPYRQYFEWRGETFAAFVDRGEVAVVRTEDLQPRSIPTVWCEDWRVEG